MNEVEGKPAVFYMHPWESTLVSRGSNGSRLSRFRHYRNLAKTESRLRRLLKDFRFGPMTDVISAGALSPEP